MVHDFRQEKYDQIICILKSGKVTGLNVLEEAKQNEKNKMADEVKLEAENTEALQSEKLNLEFEISQLKEKI